MATTETIMMRFRIEVDCGACLPTTDCARCPHLARILEEENKKEEG
jgi:hypothetical protein